LGCPVYALDRRGSGLSRQQRGHVASFRQIVDDIGQVIQYAAKRHGAHRIHLVGHCFGAIAAVLIACERPESLASLILATPALYTRMTVPLVDKVAIAVSRLDNSTRYLPIPFPADLLTELADYRSFIRHDPLALDQLTATFYYQIFRACLSLSSKATYLHLPVFMALAGRDRISQNRKNETFFRRIPATHKKVVIYPDAAHILEFSSERERFFHDLSEWIAGITPHDSGDRTTHVTEDKNT
jgi:alpha-beta hydrolase superfamily lysophospholipase